MSNYLSMNKKQLLHQFNTLGWSKRRISRETGIHRKTVAKYLNQNVPEVPADFLGEKGQSVPEVPADFLSKKRQSKPQQATESLPLTNSKSLLAHLDFIAEKLELDLTAQRVYQDLVEERDYKGSYYSVKRYMAKCKKKTPKYFERLSTFPGKEAQVDYGDGPKIWDGNKMRKTWFFKMTLSHSKHAYEELVWSQKMESFFRSHENAFKAFGGVPESVKIDNLKSAVLTANLYEPEINPAYLAFCDHWGIAPNPCAPYHPEQKGRVEKDVGYTKSNALKGREFKSIDEANLFLKHWNKRWARTRIHGTVKKQVWQMFTGVERKYLKPLKEKPFPYFNIGKRKVDVYGHIEVKGSYYSVPHYLIGKQVDIRFNDLYVKSLFENEVVSSHKATPNKGSVRSKAEHRPPEKPVNQEQEEMFHLARAKKVGANCFRLIYKMLSMDDIRSIHKVRGIMTLIKKYPAKILNEACDIALGRYTYSFQMVKSLCELLEKDDYIEESALLQEHELIRDLTEYQSIIDQ